MNGYKDVCTMAIWVIHWLFDDRWISVSQGMRTDVLVRHPIYEELCNWSQWLWSHGEWLDLISRRFGLAWDCNFGMTALCYEEWFLEL